MERISLQHICDIGNDNIEELLKRNPQLRDIEILHCRHIDRFFQLVTTHVPDVETLAYGSNYWKRENDECYGSLKKLKSLTLVFQHIEDVLQSIRLITSANSPLQYLKLNTLDLGRPADDVLEQVVGEVAKFKKLETFFIQEEPAYYGFTSSHIVRICEKSMALRELILYINFDLEPQSISEMLRNAGKLEVLSIGRSSGYGDEFSVDLDTYKEWMGIFEERRAKVPLAVDLSANCYTTNMIKSHEMARNKNFSVKIGQIVYWGKATVTRIAGENALKKIDYLPQIARRIYYEPLFLFLFVFFIFTQINVYSMIRLLLFKSSESFQLKIYNRYVSTFYSFFL